MSSHWIEVNVSSHLRLGNESLSRATFFKWAWAEFMNQGLVGVLEGSVDARENVFHVGNESEKVDWIGDLQSTPSKLYFSSDHSARHACNELRRRLDPKLVGEPVAEEDQDWDAIWKRSFTGVFVKPCWQITPPHLKGEKKVSASTIEMILNPGAGFGTGTHETTQLCLSVLGELGAKSLAGKRVLDFGSGSGILSIASALLGAEVFGVEIDPLAVENAQENASLNGVESSVGFFPDLLPDFGKFDLVIANILRPVLMDSSELLLSVLNPGGRVLLSGLLEQDLEPIAKVYGASPVLSAHEKYVKELADWRAVLWSATQASRSLS